MIRKATLNDIPSIQAIAEIAFRATYKDILSPEQMDYMMDMMYSSESLKKQFTVDRNTFFIEDNSGYVSIRPDGITSDGKSLFHLEKLYVLPEYQKSGLGRRLFEMALKFAADEAPGGARVELNVNRYNSALGFYEHMGMHRARQGDFEIGNGFYMNDFIMSIDL